MDWEQTLSTDELMCFEQRTQSVSTRIESRKTEDGWAIYKTYFNKDGINHTEEYIAPTQEKMKQIVKALKKEKRPTTAQLQKILLEKSKDIQLNIERAFKEYNVEKWKFGINSDASTNFALVRCTDDVEIDIVMHESYKGQEETITSKLLQVLGFENMDEVLSVTVFYFSKQSEQKFETQTEPELDFI